MVALQVVSELGASLSLTERRLIAHASPSVPEACDRYLHALALYAADRSQPEIFRYFVRFLATGETAGWREEHDRLLRASPGESSLGFLTRWMLICTGDLAGQIALYEKVSGGDLLGPEPLDYLLGVTHTAAGDRDRARPYLTKVASASLAPDDAYAHVFCGRGPRAARPACRGPACGG